MSLKTLANATLGMGCFWSFCAMKPMHLIVIQLLPSITYTS